ncbi:MAG: Zn-dependent protease, partial [Gammaproteobacteria bacterium]
LLCGALLPLYKYRCIFSGSGDCLPINIDGGIWGIFFSEILRNGLVVAIAILLLSFFGYLRYYSGGGAGIAESMGGRLLTRESAASLSERRLLNVVEEMALAAGMAVPPVYLLDGEKSINAFAAGLTPESAVIGITKGAVENFSRSELQGVIAHEFSHILNGDMRLNLRLAGMIFGLYCLFRVGQELLSINSHVRFEGGKRRGGSSQIMVIALLFFCIGLLGFFASRLLRAAVARQREYLADASAVQFTRDNNCFLQRHGSLAI